MGVHNFFLFKKAQPVILLILKKEKGSKNHKKYKYSMLLSLHDMLQSFLVNIFFKVQDTKNKYDGFVLAILFFLFKSVFSRNIYIHYII
uniref:Uncharacterized protein n=1 Tax=Anguilla anguilla TaxID=7936 RepID=A0A0E9X8S2_ANGAN